MEQQLFEALKISSLELITLVGPLIVLGLILGIMERKANRYFFAAYGMKGILATAWLGTPIHELGHALMLGSDLCRGTPGAKVHASRYDF